MTNKKAEILLKLALLDNAQANKDLIEYVNGLESKINKSKNNDSIYELLEILEEIAFKVPDEVLSIIKKIASLKNPLKPTMRRIKGFGPIEGKSHQNLAVKSIDILTRIRYIKPKEVFDLFIKLSLHSNSEIQKSAGEAIVRLVKYDLRVIEKVNYRIQEIVLQQLEKWSEKKIIKNSEPLLLITKELLRPSFEGQSWDYNSLTLKFGGLRVNDNLKEIRKRTIDLLKKTYEHSTDVIHKKRILQVLKEATQAPHHGPYGDDIEQLILVNTKTLVDYYINIIPIAEHEVIKEIEDQLNWFLRRFGKGKLAKISKLESSIASNLDYQVFRLFVGYDRWEEDYKEAAKIRTDKVRQSIKSISTSTFKKWHKRILSIASHYHTNKSDEFRYFNSFLFELGKHKSNYALRLVNDNEKELEPFLVYLLAGIWDSESKGMAKEILLTWVKQGKHLSTGVAVFDYTNDIDDGLLEMIFERAKLKGNVQTLNNIAYLIVRNYPKRKDLNPLLLSGIRELTKQRDYWWINNVWYTSDSILKSFTEIDFDLVLEYLLLKPDIDYHVEQILVPVAEQYPYKLVAFFEKRVSIQAKIKRDEKYDAIPYDFHSLNDPLQKHTDIVVSEVLKRFSTGKWLQEWEAGHFLQAIFPSFHNILETSLISLIQKRGRKNAAFVLAILRAYQGQSFLYKVCKEFIKHYPKNKEYKVEMFIILSQTGVVSGEYGMVEAYKRKKEEIQTWKKDHSPAIRTFLREYEDYLDRHIGSEQKRADEDLELRKREF